MKTLLIIDDHPIVLEGISGMLSPSGYKVIKANSAAQAMVLASKADYIDIVVCDLQLDGSTDGLTLIEHLRTLGLRKPTIVYTMHDELWNIQRLSKAHLDGIVLKGDNVIELVQAIELVANGEKYYSPAFDRRRMEVLQTNGILSSKAIEILRRISDGESNHDISEALGIGEKAIEYHRSNILKKLCSKTMSEAIKRAMQLGIIPLKK